MLCGVHGARFTHQRPTLGVPAMAQPQVTQDAPPPGLVERILVRLLQQPFGEQVVTQLHSCLSPQTTQGRSVRVIPEQSGCLLVPAQPQQGSGADHLIRRMGG